MAKKGKTPRSPEVIAWLAGFPRTAGLINLSGWWNQWKETYGASSLREALIKTFFFLLAQRYRGEAKRKRNLAISNVWNFLWTGEDDRCLTVRDCVMIYDKLWGKKDGGRLKLRDKRGAVLQRLVSWIEAQPDKAKIEILKTIPWPPPETEVKMTYELGVSYLTSPAWKEIVETIFSGRWRNPQANQVMKTLRETSKQSLAWIDRNSRVVGLVVASLELALPTAA